MSIKNHFDALKTRHTELEEELRKAITSHLPLEEIKKEKLKIKDEMSRLEKLLHKEDEIAA